MLLDMSKIEGLDLTTPTLEDAEDIKKNWRDFYPFIKRDRK